MITERMLHVYMYIYTQRNDLLNELEKIMEIISTQLNYSFSTLSNFVVSVQYTLFGISLFI